MSKPKSITAKRLLLAEGRDAELFLVWAGRYFRPEKDFQVMDFGGITELTDFLLLLVNDEWYDDVETIVVARDAETQPPVSRAVGLRVFDAAAHQRELEQRLAAGEGESELALVGP